jgi:hypothetical protein
MQTKKILIGIEKIELERVRWAQVLRIVELNFKNVNSTHLATKSNDDQTNVSGKLRRTTIFSGSDGAAPAANPAFAGIPSMLSSASRTVFL